REQAAVPDRAAPLVKPGGRIAYVTCSLLAEENGDQVRGFIARHPGFAVAPAAELLAPLGERALIFRQAVLMSEEGLQMTPRRTDTDGFFVSVMVRREILRHGRLMPAIHVLARKKDVDARLRGHDEEGGVIVQGDASDQSAGAGRD